MCAVQYRMTVYAFMRNPCPGCTRHALLCKRCLESSFQIDYDDRVRPMRPGSVALYLATTLTHYSIACVWSADPSLQIMDRHANCKSRLVPSSAPDSCISPPPSHANRPFGSPSVISACAFRGSSLVVQCAGSACRFVYNHKAYVPKQDCRRFPPFVALVPRWAF